MIDRQVRVRRLRRGLLVAPLLAIAPILTVLTAAGEPDQPGPAPPAGGGAKARAEVAVIGTPYGDIVWRFFDQDAPEHAAYVKALIRRGFYDGTSLHRVIPHFVVQGGDPNSKDQDRANDGEGEADRRLKAEFSTRLHYRPGTVGMARDTDPDSGSCQFFIALTDLPRLDNRYTIFGEVIEGLEVARHIGDLPRDLNDNPLERVPITARLERRRVTGVVRSPEPAGGSGEILTGPDKPQPFDPGNRHWAAPRLVAGPGDGAAAPGDRASAPGPPAPADTPPARIEIAIATDGSVLDVRFPGIIGPGPVAELRRRALAWRFEPATFEGAPRKVRVGIDSDGSRIGPPTGGGAPIEWTPALTPPRPALRVPLPPGRPAPPDPARLRMSIDETGGVVDVWLQSSCGDAGLDEAAIAAARRMAFEPATRPDPGGGKPNPVSVYLDIEAHFAVAD